MKKRNAMKNRLYLIPGTLCNPLLWSELAVQLNDYELVHLPIPSASNVEQLIDQFASVLPAQKVNLLGFSLGAYLASLVTLRYPEKVGRLMLVSNSPCALSGAELESRQHNLQLIERFGYKAMSQKKAEAMLDTSRLHPTEVQHIVKIIRQMDSELGVEVLKLQLRITSQRKDLKTSLLGLRLPLCFVYSEQDPLINLSWINDFAQHSHAVIHGLAGSGHMLPLEQPKVLSHYIRQWHNLK